MFDTEKILGIYDQMSEEVKSDATVAALLTLSVILEEVNESLHAVEKAVDMGLKDVGDRVME